MKQYQVNKNLTKKPVRWYVDLSCFEVEAVTEKEAEKKALDQIKKEGVEICNIEMAEHQEVEESEV